jgi:hypothetical protein
MKAGPEGSAPENPQHPEYGGGRERDPDHGRSPADDVCGECVAQLMEIRCDGRPSHNYLLPRLRF